MLGILYLAMMLFGGMIFWGLCGIVVERLCQVECFLDFFTEEYRDEQDGEMIRTAPASGKAG